MNRRTSWLPALLALAACPAANAQRADDNAVVAASDAFGTVVGTQTIGLYTPTSARGFNPTQAENLRIEGFYYDQQPQSANPFLFSGSDMRVGIAAQSYAFPSPSGIVDYKLRVPGFAAGASAVLIRGPIKEYSAEIDTTLPVVPDAMSIGINLADQQGWDYAYALKNFRKAITFIGRIEPAPGTEIVPFFGYTYNTEEQETAYVYAGPQGPMPYFQEMYLPTQSWTTWDWNQVTAGVIARTLLAGPWSVRAGVFRSVDENSTNYNDLFVGLQPNGSFDHVLDVVPARRAKSYSGDLRVVREVVDGAHRSELTLAVRGRQVDREYGGDFVHDYLTGGLNDYTDLPKPNISFTPESRDDVHQSGIGINYAESWKGVASLNLGLLRTAYSRVVTIPNQPIDQEKSTKLLPTASFTVDASRTVRLYGSYTRGLEDSLVAPASAVNGGEPPPATPTWQADAGASVAVQPNLQLLLGGFRIHKTYFSVDPLTNVYRAFGDISATGLESSARLTGAGGLTVVAGAVWLRPELAGGSTPVGPVPRTINVNVDYAPKELKGWAGSLQWTSLSSRVAASNDAYSLPPFATLNVGIRYRFTLLERAASVRLDAGNVTNQAGATISNVYLLTPQLQRNYTLTLAVDL